MSAGERIVLRNRQHWFVLVWSARYAVLALIASLVLFVVGQNVSADVRTGPFGQLLGILTAVAFIGGLAYLVWQGLRYRSQEYVLTNRRVMQAEGVVNKRVTDSSLEKINDAELIQSFVGRIFGFGDLDVLTASESGIERFRMILDPIAFKRAMLEAKHEYEIETNRGYTPVAPPVRAAAEGGRSAAGAARSSTSFESVSDATDQVAVPVAPDRRPTLAADAADRGEGGWTGADGSPTGTAAGGQGSAAGSSSARMTPDEVTRTLASLADLRDRGAISAEEYEGKKRELLGRL
jgi:hypothetical protein